MASIKTCEYLDERFNLSLASIKLLFCLSIKARFRCVCSAGKTSLAGLGPNQLVLLLKHSKLPLQTPHFLLIIMISVVKESCP